MTIDMPKAARISTLRGLGPDDHEVSDDDIFEVDGEAPPVSRVSMTCLAATRMDDSVPPMPLAIVPRRLFSGVFEVDEE